MKKMSRLVSGLVCTLLLLSAGCVKLWQENLDIRTYKISATRDLPVAEKPLADKLWVDTAVVLSPGNSRNLILKESDVEFTTSYYTELLMSPAENFQNIVYTWFTDSGLFQTVSLVDREGMSHRLAVTVMDFYSDTVNRKAVLKIKLTLFDEKTKGVRVLFSRDYLQEVAVADTNADELVRAYNAAVTKILIDCEGDVASALK